MAIKKFTPENGKTLGAKIVELLGTKADKSAIANFVDTDALATALADYLKSADAEKTYVKAETLEDYMDSEAVKAAVEEAKDALKKEILTGDATGTIVEAYDTLLEIGTWINTEGKAAAALGTDVTALKAAVGDEESGLVKDVAELTTAVEGKAKAEHTHTIDNVEGLQDALDAKAKAADVYTKTEADGKFLTGHQDISGKADKEHTHKIADVEGLQDALDTKLEEKDFEAYTEEEINSWFTAE